MRSHFYKEIDKNLEQRAGWSDSDLSIITDKIKIALIGRTSFTMDEIIEAAETKTVGEIGYFFLWIVKKDTRLRGYLPFKLIQALSRKIEDEFEFERVKGIEKFIRNNWNRGPEWIAARLYITPEQAASYYKGHIVKGRGICRYSEDDKNYIRANKPKGAAFLASHFGVSEQAIYAEASRLNVSLSEESHFNYSEQEYSVLRNASLEEQSDEDLTHLLNLLHPYAERSVKSVTRRRRKLLGARRETFDWAAHPDYVQYLVEHPAQSHQEAAYGIGLRKDQVRGKRYQLRKQGRL